MMHVKFNKFERVAGLFVLLAIVGSIVTALSVAVKQGWFENKFKYQTVFNSADGIHSGTVVQMAGLRAGSVEEIELLGNNKIKVVFYVMGKFQNRIRSDSKTQLVRPFVIGDRVLEVSVGSDDGTLVSEGVGHSFRRDPGSNDLDEWKKIRIFIRKNFWNVGKCSVLDGDFFRQDPNSIDGSDF
jgi:ABC-type transporter Mla subunit MlaD